MASIRYRRARKRWEVRRHATAPDGRKVLLQKVLPAGSTRADAEQIGREFDREAREIKLGRSDTAATLAAAVLLFERYCRRHTERTQGHYRNVLRRFVASLPPRVRQVREIAPAHIEAYVQALIDRGLTARTCNAHLTPIKAFGAWVADTYGLTNPARPVKMLPQEPPEQRFLSPDEFDKIVEAAGDTPVRDRVLFLAHTGLRASEFAGLRWRHVSDSLDAITFTGKGRKPRTVPLNAVARGILQRIQPRNYKPNDPIFLSQSYKKAEAGKPCTRHGLYQSCAKLAEKAGIEPFGPHALRHWFATRLLLAGVPIAHVSLLLGHSSISTTERIYIHVQPADVAAVTSVLCPPARRRA